MDRTKVTDTLKAVGKDVKLNGWVDTIRDHRKVTFIDLRDRTGLVQCVGSKLPKVTSESVVEITGKVANRPEKLVNPNLDTGKVEVKIEKLKILALSEEQLPFPLDGDGLDIEEELRLK